MTRSTFIKIVVISYWKPQNLPINNEKLINFKNLGLLSLPTWILSYAPLCVTSYLISCLHLVFCALLLSPCLSLLRMLCIMFLISSLVLSLMHLLLCFSPLRILCIAFFASSLAFVCLVYYISRLVSDFVSCGLCFLLCFWSCVLYVASLVSFLVLCIMRCISCLISHLLGFRSYLSKINLLYFSLHIISLDK